MPESRSRERREMLDELLVRRASEPLDRAARTALDRLLAEFPEVDATAFDRAAAAIWLASVPRSEPMPAALRQDIFARAADRIGKRQD